MNKRLLKDVSINFLTTFIVLFTVQLLYYPEISNKYDALIFGEFIYIVSIINLFGSLIGGTISNVYLKKYSLWKEQKILFQKFNSLILFSLFLYIGSLSIFVVTNSTRLFEVKFTSTELILIFLIILFNQLRIIFTVWLRAQLDYKHILVLNLLMAFVYVSGWFLLKFNFEFNVLVVLLIAELVFCFSFFCLSKDHVNILIPKESSLDKELRISIFLLLLSSIFYTLYKYIDRILIGNFIDVKLVPVFYIANITGLIFATPFNVLSNVIFSYIAQKNKIEKKQLKILIFGPIILAAILLVISSIFGPWLIKVLYNQYYEASLEIFYIVNLGNSILVIDYLLRGYIIKFYKEGYKLFADIIAIVIFISVALLSAGTEPLVSVAYGYTAGIVSKCLYNYLLIFIHFYKTK